MKLRKLGRTGIEVSVVALGGEGFEGKPYDVCEGIIDHAFSAGVNFVELYNSNPEVRSNVGQALARYPRESFVVEGHLCSAWSDGQYHRTRDIDKVKAAFSDFMVRMQLDYVDIGMLHYVDMQEDFEAVFNGPIFEYAQELKGQGLIRCIGLSTHNTDVALAAARTGLIDVLLFSINPAYDMVPASDDVNVYFSEGTYDRTFDGIDPKRAALYQLCEQEGVALTVMKGLAAGMLLDGSRSPFGQAMTPVQCIHYCLTRPGVASVTVGLTSLEQIDASVAYATASDAEKDYSEIIAGGPRSSLVGHCMYCGHCAPCSSGIDIAAVNKYVDLAEAQLATAGEVPETLKDHYAVLGHTADECIECGSCEENCPFEVQIIEKMRRAQVLFG